MNTQNFHHALKVEKDICVGCSHCMSACPTEAIRIVEGKAKIYGERCIDCGECFKVCPVSAIYVEQDDFNMIFNYKYRVALVPSVLIGQFEEDIKTVTIYSVLFELGFTHVYEVEQGVDVLSDTSNSFLVNNRDVRPLISSFCPAVIRLIQVKFPALVDNIMLLKPPLDIAALHYKKKLVDGGALNNEIGVFYVTPCAAKIAAVKSPVGEDKSLIDGVINMNFIYNKILSHVKDNVTKLSSVPDEDTLSRKGILWSLTNGEADNAEGRCLAIDEIHNVIEFLEKVENEEILNVDFLELRACDESCAGGVLTTRNRFLTVERLKKRAKTYKNEVEPLAKEDRDYLVDNIHISKIEPRSIMKLDEDIERALEKMKKSRKLMCYLPGFDCGACGSPSCQALAEDIAQGQATLSYCVFMQRVMEKHLKLSSEHAFKIIEKIWGKDRLDKDCNKRGALNDSF